MAQRYLYLVRHGQKDHTQDGLDTLGGGLTALGREQAEFTAQRLAGLPINMIHTSSLRRAAQTAGIIALHFPEAPVKPARVLWECIPFMPKKFVQWYQEHAAELESGKARIPHPYLQWLNIFPHTIPFEKIEAGFRQAERAYARYFKPVRGANDRHEMIICHGNLIRYFVARALGAPPESWVHSDIANCGLSEVIVASDGTTMLIAHNDTGHLPDGKRTFL